MDVKARRDFHAYLVAVCNVEEVRSCHAPMTIKSVIPGDFWLINSLERHLAFFKQFKWLKFIFHRPGNLFKYVKKILHCKAQ